MSKKPSKSQKAKKAAQNQQPSSSRRKLIMIPAAALAIGTTAFGLNALEMNKRELHDLSVIGNGTPAIVQIHDPSCPTCRRLKNIMKNTMGSEEQVQYRLADLTTIEGKALATRYNVPKITLLYFDAKGKHVHTTQGIQEPDSIRTEIQKQFGSHN